MNLAIILQEEKEKNSEWEEEEDVNGEMDEEEAEDDVNEEDVEYTLL